MSDEKKYYDSNGQKRTLYRMVRHEQAWACNRIREGEAAIEEVKRIIEQRDKLFGKIMGLEKELAEACQQRDEARERLHIQRGNVERLQAQPVHK